MAVGEVLVEAIKILVPPKADDAEGQTRWRWVVFATLIGLIVTLGAHIAIACGALPSISSGFALEADQKATQRRIDVIATLSIQNEIRSKTLELCMEHDPSRRSELNRDIDKLQYEYKEVAGNWYTVPPCDKL